MKIAIDGRCFTSNPAGIANFTLNAINSLSRNPDIYIYIFAHKELHKEILQRILFRGNVFIIIDPLTFLKKIGLLWFILKLPFLARSIHADIIWGPGQVIPSLIFSKRILRMVTIHDFVFKHYKRTMSFRTKLENRLFTAFSIKNADYIWCVSNYTKEELINLYPKRKCQKVFVGSGIDNDKFKVTPLCLKTKEEIHSLYGVRSSLMLFVGTLEPRKNLNFLFGLMPKLKNYGVTLLVVGNKGWGDIGLEANRFPDNFPFEMIKFTGCVSTKVLVELYSVADLLVCPSINEGFGMPLLEGMACGCPIIAAHNSAMIEVVSGVGLTISGWNNDDWINGILSVIKDPKKYTLGYQERIKKYDWIDISERLIKYLK